MGCEKKGLDDWKALGFRRRVPGKGSLTGYYQGLGLRAWYKAS